MPPLKPLPVPYSSALLGPPHIADRGPWALLSHSLPSSCAPAPVSIHADTRAMPSPPLPAGRPPSFCHPPCLCRTCMKSVHRIPDCSFDPPSFRRPPRLCRCGGRAQRIALPPPPPCSYHPLVLPSFGFLCCLLDWDHPLLLFACLGALCFQGRSAAISRAEPPLAFLLMPRRCCSSYVLLQIRWATRMCNPRMRCSVVVLDMQGRVQARPE